MIAARLGVDYVFFIPQYIYHFSFADSSDKGIFRFFESTFKINSKGFLSPEVSFGYYYSLGKYITPFLSFDWVYSNRYPIEGLGFRLKGKNEILEGNFRRRFVHAGLEIGVKVSFYEQGTK